MQTHRIYRTIEDPKQLTLSDLPFQKGQQVEILILALDPDHQQQINALRDFFKTVQAMPSSQTITEAEIAAYRQWL